MNQKENSKIERNISIQIIRIFAMLLIIICHFCNYSTNKFIQPLGQFFDVGVFIFILISGYLYGNKNIKNNFKWIFDRVKKIWLPSFIFSLFVIFLTMAITDVVDLKYVFIYLFNMQYFLGGINGANHLWFISVIIICYLLVPLFHKHKYQVITKFNYIFLFTLIFSIFVGFFSKIYGLLSFYILTFYIGYFIRNNENFFNIRYAFFAISFVIGIIIRLLGKILLDDTLFYVTTIVGITHIIIAVSLFCVLYKLFNKLSYKQEDLVYKIINFFDNLSYYIFIVHYMFIVGPVSIMDITNNVVVNLLIYSFMIVASAYALRIVTDTFTKINYKKINFLSTLQFLEIFLIVLYKYFLVYNFRNNLILYSLILLSGITCLVILFNKRKMIKRNDFIIFCILSLLSLGTIIVLKSVNFVFPLMIAISFYNESPKKIAKMFFWTLSIGFVMTLILNCVNILPDKNLSRLINGVITIRYGLGFVNTAFVMLYYIHICLAYYCGYGYSKKCLLMTLFFGLILFYLCNSRTGLISLLAFETLIIFNQYFKISKKIFSIFTPAMFSAIMILVIIFIVISVNFDMSEMNAFLTGRINFITDFYEKGYFATWFGVTEKLTTPLDIYYLYPLIKLGIIGCLVFNVLNFVSLFRLRNDSALMLIEIIILLYGLGDTNVIVSSINFMLSIQALVLINPTNKYFIEGEIDEKETIN